MCHETIGNSRWQKRKKRPNRFTNNEDMAETANYVTFSVNYLGSESVSEEKSQVRLKQKVQTYIDK